MSQFDSFTNLYSLQKTLRFELKPVGETRKWMNKKLKYDFALQTFFKDQEIEDAYQVLKPVFDKIHEEFITNSLENDEAKRIFFGEYFDAYKKFRNETDKDEKIKLEKLLGNEEKRLRGLFAAIYKVQGEIFKNEVGRDEKGKSVLKEESYKVLTEAGILKYIKKRIDDFVAMDLKTRNEESVTKKKLEKALVKNGEANKGVFEGFFTYLTGFNQNRENYYSVDDKATSVASRIVGENLPKFCDNALDFSKRKNEYENALQFLKNKSIATQDKNGNELYKIEAEFFEIVYFNNCLSQKEIEDYNKKISNANFIINLYNQQQTEKDKKLRGFKTLYKQIGCGDKKEFIPAIKSDEELKKILDDVVTKGERFFVEIKSLTDSILALESFNGVYWSDKALNTISSKYFWNWDSLKELLKTAKIFKKEKDEIKIPQTIELSELFTVLDQENAPFKEIFKDNNEKKQEIIRSNGRNSSKLLRMIFVDIEANQKVFEQHREWISSSEPRNDGFYKKDEYTQIVKALLDAILFSNQILKYFKVRENKIKGNLLNAEISEPLDKILFEGNPTEYYDLVRNYLTHKPTMELNKLKLNFENGQLLGGWSDGQEKNKGAVILQKDGKYFVGILSKKNIFDTEKENDIYNENGDAGRLILMNLKFQTLAGKGYLGKFGISYGKEGKDDPKIAIKHLQQIIKEKYVEKYPLLKKFVGSDWKDKKIFDREIQDTLKECYVCEFRKISWGKIESLISSGDLFVFKIFSREKVMQNWYWEEVFRENSTAQLLGGAEIFYRPACTKIEKNVKKGYENKKDKKTGENYILENKRFTEEKFLFHCPIKLNYKEPDRWYKYNDDINKVITANENDVCFIGIDRGEKHLAYYSVVNQKGNILEQGSFNEINGQDYAEKLEKKAGNRDGARKDWKTIGTIKELKDGYISQIVRKIVDLAISKDKDKKELREVPAFIVLENLNSGFKRGRQKIEKQVYQKLEFALAKKMNFLVDKKAKEGEIGSVQKALQMTPPVTNFSDIENAKQFGIMLYVRANYTSQIDPITGWRKTIRFESTTQESLKKEMEKKFNEIGFDGKDYYFKYKDENTGKLWILWSGKNGKELERFRWNNKTHIIEQKFIIKELEKVFGKLTTKTNDLKSKITENNVKDVKYAIDLIQQIRNTGINKKDDDFILSPVRDENDNHFDSRENNAVVPNGDANGAYNIARKGLLMNEHIKRQLQLFISDIEWDIWLTRKDEWEKWLEKNKENLKIRKK